jgi:hypothetical protein
LIDLFEGEYVGGLWAATNRKIVKPMKPKIAHRPRLCTEEEIRLLSCQKKENS